MWVRSLSNILCVYIKYLLKTNVIYVNEKEGALTFIYRIKLNRYIERRQLYKGLYL